MPGPFQDTDWEAAFFSAVPTVGKMTPPPEREESFVDSLELPDFITKATSAVTWPGRKINELAGRGFAAARGIEDERPFSAQMAEVVAPTGQEATPGLSENLLTAAGLSFPSKLRQLGREFGPEAQEYAAKAARPVVGVGVQSALDPLMYGALGALNKLPYGAALHKALGVAFTGEMGIGAIKAAKNALDIAQRDGFTPDAVEAGMEALTTAGFAGMGAYGMVGGRVKKPGVAEAVEGAKRDNVNPFDAALEELGAQADPNQLLPPPGEGFRDVRLGEDTPLTPQAGHLLHDLSNKALAVANAELATPTPLEGQIAPGPSPIRQVVILDRNEVPHPATGAPTPIQGNAAQVGDTIYITRRGALTLLQADDAAGIMSRVNQLVAHEVAHPQGAAMPQVQRGPMGEPLPQGARPTEAGHAPGGLYDDSVQDLNFQMLEHSLTQRLNIHPGLQGEARGLQERGLEGLLQPATDLSPTAGSSQDYILRLAAELQGRELPSEMEGATPPETMAPPPEPAQAGSRLKDLWNKARGRQEVTPEALERAGFKDPRFLLALQADQARQAAAQAEVKPTGPQVGDVIRAPLRPGAMTFPPSPKSAALRGEEVKGPAPVRGPLDIRQRVPEGTELYKHFRAQRLPAKGRIAAEGRVDYLKAADEAIAIGRRIKGSKAPVDAWRAEGFQVGDLRDILNNLSVARTKAAKQGNQGAFDILDQKIKELQTFVLPRLVGTNKRYSDIILKRASERAATAQASMMTQHTKRPLASIERRIAKAGVTDEKVGTRKGEALEAYKAMRKAHLEMVDAAKRGDLERFQVMANEVANLIPKLKSEISLLPEGARLDASNKATSTVREMQKMWARLFGERKTAEAAKARQEGVEEDDLLSPEAGAKKRKQHRRTKTTSGKLLAPPRLAAVEEAEGIRHEESKAFRRSQEMTARKAEAYAKTKPTTYHRIPYDVADISQREPTVRGEAIATGGLEGAPPKSIKDRIKDLIWGARRRQVKRTMPVARTGAMADAVEGALKTGQLNQALLDKLSPADRKEVLENLRREVKKSTFGPALEGGGKGILERLRRALDIEQEITPLAEKAEIPERRETATARTARQAEEIKETVEKGKAERPSKTSVTASPEIIEAREVAAEKHAPKIKAQRLARLKEAAKKAMAMLKETPRAATQPYTGQRLEELGATAAEKAKALSAHLDEAAKEGLGEASWSKTGGIKSSLKGRSRISPKQYTTAEWYEGLKNRINTADPHGAFAAIVRADNAAAEGLFNYLRNHVLKPHGGVRFDADTLKSYHFSKPTGLMVRRIWNLVNAPKEILKGMGMEEAEIKALSTDRGRVEAFEGYVRHLLVSYNAVPYKYFGPEFKGKPTSRLAPYLDQLSKEGPSLTGEMAKALKRLAGKSFVTEALTRPGHPSMFAERKGPYGALKESVTRTLEFKDAEGNVFEERLLPLPGTFKAVEEKLGVTLTPEEKLALKDVVTSPGGAGRRKVYSTTELIKLLPDAIIARADKAGKEWVDAARGLEYETEPLKVFKYVGGKATKDFTLQDVAKIKSYREPSARGEFTFPTFAGDTSGVPTSLNPYGSAEPTVRIRKGRKGAIKSSVEADIDKGKNFAKFTATFKAPPPADTTTEGATGQLRKPFFRSPRVLGKAETALQQERDSARLLAAQAEVLSGSKYKKAKAAAVETGLKEYDTLLDSAISSAGIKTGRGSIGRLWTKRAIYDEQVATHGAEWAKKNPFNTFRPEMVLDPVSEKLVDVVGERTAFEEGGRQLAGEYYYDIENIREMRKAEIDRIEKDFDKEHLEAREKFEEERLSELESKEAERVEQEERGLDVSPSTDSFIRSKGGYRSLYNFDLRKVREWVDARVKSGDIATDDRDQVIDNIREAGLDDKRIQRMPPKNWMLSSEPGKKFLRTEAVEEARRRVLDDEDFAEQHGWKDYPPEESDAAQAGAKKRKQHGLKPAYDSTGKRTLDAMHDYFNSPTYKRSLRWASKSQKWNWKLIKATGEILNITRPLKTMADLSNPFRNTFQLTTDQLARDLVRYGKGAVGKRTPHDTSLRKNLWDMTKAFGSDATYKELKEVMENDPYYKMAQAAGTRFITETDVHEGFIGKDALNLVLDKLGPLGKGIKWVEQGSERAYNYYQNKAMRDAYRHGLEFFEKGGLFNRLSREGATHDDVVYVDEALRNLKDYVNMAGSRSQLTKDNHVNDIANYLLYSGQMNISRLKMLGYAGRGFTSYESPEMRTYARHQVLRSLAGGMAGVSMIYALARAAGEEPKIELDPRSSDFMKVRFGPIAYDGWGGMQQWFRAGAQVVRKERKEISTGKIVDQPVLDTIVRFARSKASPGAQLVVDFFAQRTAEGEAFDPTKDPAGFASTLAKNLLMPMSVEDMGGIMRENPKLGFLIPLMLLGNGVSTSRGAKERWLGMNPFDPEVRAKHLKTSRLEKELREYGVSGPRLSHKVTLPGKDIYGKRNYYNMTPGEVAQFEQEFMPMITDLLVEYIESPRYQSLPRSKRPAALQKHVHKLNEKYGAARRLKKKYAGEYKMGRIKPSGIVGSEVRDLSEALVEERSGKGER